MSSSDPAAEQSSKISSVLDLMGMDLAFVEEGKNTGVLPVNAHLLDLEDLLDSGSPAALREALGVARKWMDAILDGGGNFSAASIRAFNEWHPWMVAAVADWEAERSIAPFQSSVACGDQPASSDSAGEGAEQGEAEIPIILDLNDDPELLREFLSESAELLRNIEQGVLVLEENPADKDTINSIFRAFHTFKGGAGFLHLDALQHLAHEFESLLDAVRKGDLSINKAIIDLILAGADALESFTVEIGAQLNGANAGGPIVIPTADLIRRAKGALRGEFEQPASAAAEETVPAQEAGTEAASVPVEIELAHPAPKPNREVVPMVHQTRPVNSPTSESASGFVKVDTAKLDMLVDMVGELVIAQSMVVQNADSLGFAESQISRNLRQLSRITSELQKNTLSLRMVPIAGAFQKMNRLVRDISQAQGKQVQLVLEGEETEIDRNIVEKLGDPLVHMIRNAVDHGIEPPDVRTANGKPPTGTIFLSASHQRGGIRIRIQDDGNGIDPARILAKGQERGLVPADAVLNHEEIFDLIFQPGFSTAEKVTDLSGRGVGMDVVRRNIEDLRGKVQIDSTQGEGTTFTITLPLTLAIIDGLVVRVGRDRYIIPTLSVTQCFRPTPGQVATVFGRGEVVGVRGLQTPVLRLERYLGLSPKGVEPEDGIIVVVESGDASRGILVDELVGKQEIVIKSLGDTFKNQKLLAGCAVLGDGSVGLILDVDTIVRLT